MLAQNGHPPLRRLTQQRIPSHQKGIPPNEKIIATSKDEFAQQPKVEKKVCGFCLRQTACVCKTSKVHLSAV